MKNNSSLVTNHSSPVTHHSSLIFFGDDHYSLTVLKHLHFKGDSLKISLVITREPKPVGRKQILTPSPVELFAQEHHIPVIHYNKNNPQDTCYKIQATAKSPLGVLASFGHILPPELLNLFPHGIINIHPSLLPQYRGATPVQHAITLGDQTTGVTLFKLTPKIDDGEIIAQETEPILPTDTTSTLSHRLFTKGTHLLIQHLTQPTHQPRNLNPEPRNLIYTKKFSKNTGFVPWENFYAMMENQPLPTKNLHNPLLKLRLKHQNITSPMLQDTSYMLLDLARALDPWPSVWTILPAPVCAGRQAGAPTTKGSLRLKLETKLVARHLSLVTKLAGKPNPIPWSDFKKYYLNSI